MRYNVLIEDPEEDKNRMNDVAMQYKDMGVTIVNVLDLIGILVIATENYTLEQLKIPGVKSVVKDGTVTTI